MNWREEELEHFKRIRTDPVYRLNEQLHQMAIDTEPGVWPVERIETPFIEVQPPPYEYLKQLRAEINHLKNRVHKLEKPRSKKKSNTSLKEIYDNK